MLTKILVLLALFVPAWHNINAKQISGEQASAIADNFFRSMNIRDGVINPVATSVDISREDLSLQAVKRDTEPAYYIFEPESSPGFVIVAGDDEMKAIVGYSTISSINIDNLPVQLSEYLDNYERDVYKMRSGAASVGHTAGGVAVAPLVTTRWNQDKPYNLLCIPSWSDEKLYVTGCVATAVAQVMKYHNFPPRGNGVTEDLWSNPSIDLSQSIYDWDSMKDDYTDDWTEKEGMAVARLMRDLGLALRMQYGTDASSAFSTEIAPALFRHFNYSKEARLLMRESYDSQQWIDIIRDNLCNNRPIVYGGSGNQGGHSFVCDGIDENDYLHINWGWGGSCDGYFDINALDPDEPGIGGGDGKFYKDHDMVVNIYPGDPDADNSAYTNPLMVWNFDISSYHKLDDDGLLLDKNERYPMSFTATFALYNNTNSYIPGSNTICFIRKLYDSDKKLLIEDDIDNLYGYQYGIDSHRYHPDASVRFDLDGIADGDYFVSMSYARQQWTDNGREYTYRDLDFACEPFIAVTVKDGALYFNRKPEIATPLNVTDARQTGIIYENDTKASIEVSVSNLSSKQLKKPRIAIFSMPAADASDSPDISSMPAIGYVYPYYIYAGATATYSTTISAPPTGRHRLYFAYDNKLLETDKPYFIDVDPLPDDRPFILLEPLDIDQTTYSNFDGEWMGVFYTYKSLESWSWWYNIKTAMRLYAAPADDPDNEFILYDDEECYMTFSSTRIESSLWGNPDLLWRKPGEYIISLAYRQEGQDEWVRLDDTNNIGRFTLVEYEPTDPYFTLVSPAVINDGYAVRPDSYFDVKMRIKSPSGISIIKDNSWARVSTSPSSWENVANLRSIDLGKTDLAPGEETDISLTFYMPDDESLYNGKFIVIPELPYEDYIMAHFSPGEYLESLYFTVDPQAGINDAVAYDDYNCRVVDGKITIEGLGPDDFAEIWTLDGIMSGRYNANATGQVSADSNAVRGIYIIKPCSATRNYKPQKLIVR